MHWPETQVICNGFCMGPLFAVGFVVGPIAYAAEEGHKGCVEFPFD